jgi:MFS family permease
MSEGGSKASSRAVYLAVLVAALGYFVDIYDLILFGVVGKKSLVELHVPQEGLDALFGNILDYQMLGMLTGGILWGVLGDKRGRLSVLFGSILMYSLANIANAMITDVAWYPALRFIAGVGLAGELGAGVTLVSEIMSRTGRGWGTTVIAGVGVTGAIAAALVDRYATWRTAYWIGGLGGFALLALRIGVRESGMFESVKAAGQVARGNLLALVGRADRLKRYLAVILIGTPIWYVIGILTVRASVIAKDLGIEGQVVPGTAVMICYIGLAVGDVASGVLSQLMKSRKRAVGVFLITTVLAVAFYFAVGKASLTSLYVACFALGVGGGYWAMFVTMASEQFGTNLRSTVTTTAPNFVRGSLVLLNFGFTRLQPALGVWKSTLAVGVASLGLAILALGFLEETFGKDLDYVERD